ncbi:MAG TPA: 7TM diverse intracellular signaling domain-containing protein [Chitinophagaceae bacterium]
MHLNNAYIYRNTRFFILILSIFFFSCKKERAKPQPVDSSVDVGQVRFAKRIYRSLRYETVLRNSLPDSALSRIPIQKSLPIEWFNHRVPPKIIEKDILVRIDLFNTSDSIQQVYFYPGAYFQKIDLYRVSADSQAVLVSPSETPANYRAGFRLLKIPPGDSSSYIAKLEFVRTSATMFYPAILQKDFIDSFITDKIQARSKTNLITYLVSGIMLMMILYSLAVYNLNRNEEFIYYSGYASCLALLLFLKSFLVYDFTGFNFFFESYWDFLIQCLGVASYFQFIRKFLNTKTRHPFLEKTFRVGLWVLLAFLGGFTMLYFFSSEFILLNLFENITKQLLLVIGLIFIIYGARRKEDKLLRYLVMGNVFLLFFSVVSFLLIVFPIQLISNPNFSFLNSAIIYYEIGLVMELSAFLIGLAYKNRRDTIERARERERLRMENERKELEKQMAILEAQQEERNRISADMHDELGSGVTAIRLMSEIVKAKMKGETLPEIDKISNSANDLITKMNTIIWTMSSSNDTVENLITYIRTYALDFFESTAVECEFHIPSPIPHIQLSGEKRRNIFLAVKESLNNILKHARATRVTINVEINDKLTISIQDDGVGVNFEAIRRFGNGLKNMKSRLERINGQFSIQNNGGALTQFEMNL